MNTSLKSNCLATYQVVLYDRALHPELFQLKGRRVLTRPGYECECWLMAGGHLIRFKKPGLCAAELLVDREDGLPSSGVVSAFLAAGERDYEHLFEKEGVNYIHTVQTEQLSENLYIDTLAEMRDHAREVEGLLHEWDDEAGTNLSLVDLQRYNRELHAQSYHLLAQGGVVIRTQTIFELT